VRSDRQSAGRRMVARDFSSLDEAPALEEATIFNGTDLGARALVKALA